MSGPPPPREQILAGIAAVAAEHLGLSGALDERARLVEDLGFDSLKLMIFAAEIENRFRVILEAEDEAAIVTVGDLADRLAHKLAPRQPNTAR